MTTRNLIIQEKKAAMEAEKNTPDIEHTGGINIHYVNKKPYTQYGHMEQRKIYRRRKTTKRLEKARFERDAF